MQTILKQANGNTVDLSTSKLFLEHYNLSSSFSNVILYQINQGMYGQLMQGLGSDSIILDLGGNIGLFSIYASPIVGKIISVEPTPSHLEIFKDLLSNLNINNVDIVSGAICTSNTSVLFNIGSSNTTMNSIIKHPLEHSHSINVNGLTLENILADTVKVDFCKMDIEGYENVLLQDEATVQIISSKVSKIFIEFHNFDNSSYDYHINNALQILEKNNFSCQKLSHDSLLCTNTSVSI